MSAQRPRDEETSSDVLRDLALGGAFAAPPTDRVTWEERLRGRRDNIGPRQVPGAPPAGNRGGAGSGGGASYGDARHQADLRYGRNRDQRGAGSGSPAPLPRGPATPPPIAGTTRPAPRARIRPQVQQMPPTSPPPRQSRGGSAFGRRAGGGLPARTGRQQADGYWFLNNKDAPGPAPMTAKQRQEQYEAGRREANHRAFLVEYEREHPDAAPGDARLAWEVQQRIGHLDLD